MSQARSLSGAIQQFNQSQLTQLLDARPDLAVPPPIDLGDLAERASTRASAGRAIASLDSWAYSVTLTLAALENGTEQPNPEAIAVGMGLPHEASRVSEILDRLCQLALAWGEPPHLTQAARSVFGDYPAGLAPASAQPLSHDDLVAALDQVGDKGIHVLQRLLWDNPTGAVQRADRQIRPEDAESTMDLLLAYGLLRPLSPDQVILPREVALHLRHGLVLPEPPSAQIPPWQSPQHGLLGSSLSTDLVDRAGVGSGQELISHYEVVVDDLGERTPRHLANGALSQKDRGSLARLVGDPQVADFVVALARSAAMLVNHGQSVAATTSYDHFLDQPAFTRWISLKNAWTRMQWWPSGSVVADHGVQPAALRQACLDELASAAPGTSVAPESLAARLGWRHPGWFSRLGEGSTELWSAAVDQLMQESRWLGFLAFDRVTGLVTTDAQSPDPGFPEYGDHLMMQSDLTAVAPAPLDHLTARTVGTMADRESHGATVSYRFSTASLRRAFNTGWTGDGIISWLHAHDAAGPDAVLPAPLTTLIADVSRKHGTVRVMAVNSIVRLDDPAVVASLLADPAAEDYGIRELAPGLLAAGCEPDMMVAFLRSHGLDPVGESPTGEAFLTPPVRRVPSTPRADDKPPVDTARLASRLVHRGTRGMTTSQVSKRLEAAWHQDHWVNVDWADNEGMSHSHLMRVLTINSGVANMVRRGAGRISLPIARIIAVTPHDENPTG